ncbi:MAG: hypothetical protein LLF89_01410, partial [Spirochaetaceae bacterium]|nr:hypothetical protein [Spirochaetaceae bacterium]
MSIKEVRIKPFSFEPIHESIVTTASAEAYKARIEKALTLCENEGLTHLVVYGDREHFANMHYFTGYDPRFEEAVLILQKDKEPILLVGNEGWNYSEIIPYEFKRILFQSLSLPGQARNVGTCHVLRDTFIEAGMNRESKVGIIGWKYFRREEAENPRQVFDIPHYMIRELSAIVPMDNLVNATGIMIDPDQGLRNQLDIDEMAVLELAGT